MALHGPSILTAAALHGPSILAAAALLVAGAPGDAAAYVPATTTQGTPLRWMGTSCIPVRIHADGSADITDGSDVAAARAALAAWRQATRQCAYIDFKVLPESTAALPAFTKSGPNECAIYFQRSKWIHGSGAAAITTIFFIERAGDSHDGRILDADIEINDSGFTFSTSGEPGKIDLQSVLTHEVGHLLGLDNVCFDGGSTRPKDHTGAPVPYCSTVRTSTDPALKQLREATMFDDFAPGETKRRTPEQDDVLGICSTYPLKDDPGCHPVMPGDGGVLPDWATGADGGAPAEAAGRSGCGCEVAAGPRPAAGVLLVLLLLALGLRLGRRCLVG